MSIVCTDWPCNCKQAYHSCYKKAFGCLITPLDLKQNSVYAPLSGLVRCYELFLQGLHPHNGTVNEVDVASEIEGLGVGA